MYNVICVRMLISHIIIILYNLLARMNITIQNALDKYLFLKKTYIEHYKKYE